MEISANYYTKFRHRQRLESAVSHVLESLDKSISLQDTAEISYYSPVHFQAIFAENLGETFFEYVLRNRLFLAARRLTETYEKLNDLALLSGFSSQANFTRAFKQWFELSPARFRKEYFGRQLAPVIKPKQKRRANAVPSIDFMPATTLLTCAAKGYMSSRFEHTLWEAVTQLCDQVQSSNGVIPMSSVPVYVAKDILDLTRLEQGTKMAAVEVNRHSIGDRLAPLLFDVPEGLCATFSHQGILPEQTLNVGLFDWLPTSKFELDWSRPVLMKSEQLSLKQFALGSGSKSLAKNQCLLSDGLGMDVSSIENFKVSISIPVLDRQA